MTLKNALRLW